MGKITAFLVIFLFISLHSAYADDIIVGDSNGWTTNFDYAAWAAAQTFTTNDTLVFNYGPSHALNEVGKSDYDSCNPSNYITSTSSSPSRISLASATTGMRYFICPRSNHCPSGMKLAVTVSSGTGSTTPTSPSSGNPTTPGTPTTAGSQPPPPYSAAVRSGGVAGLLVLVMGGAVFGCMG